jgi:hydrogenase maturation protease
MRTVIIGVGNPMRGDDGVGLRIARELRGRVAGKAAVDVVELCAGGLRLMEAMAGYDRAIVIDAMESGGRAGTVHRLSADELSGTRNASSTHDGSLGAAFALGRVAGLRVPVDVRVWAVEAGNVAAFGEGLTPEVEAAVDVVAADVWREVSSV